MHDAGVFDAEILSHGYDMKNSGPQLWVSFRTDRGTLAGFFSMSDAAAEYTIKKIRAMGYQGDDLAELNDPIVMSGNKCCITVEHDTYNGKTRAKVSFVDPLGGGGWTGEHDASAAKIASRMNALLRQQPKTAPLRDDAPRSSTGGGYGEQSPPPEDDYPF